MSRILLLSPSLFSVGGIQRLMREFLKFTSHEVDVITRLGEERQGNEPRIDNSLYGTRTTLGAHYVSLFRRMTSTRYDKLYISSLQHADAASVASVFGVETVIHVHGNDVFSARFEDPVTRWVRARGMCRTSRFIAVSDWTGAQLAQTGIESDRIQVIPNGVDFTAFGGSEASVVRKQMRLGAEDFVLLTVSRLVPRKGHALVIEAMRGLPGVVYLIVGEGSERVRLQQLAKSAGISNRVTFTGYVPDEALPDYYHACDAFVMASQHMGEAGSVEGFGLTYLEANAAGKAVIGTRTGGIASAIKHEYNGLLCEPDAASVAQAVRRLKEDARWRRILERNALRWAKEHDWSVVVGHIDDVLAT